MYSLKVRSLSHTPRPSRNSKDETLPAISKTEWNANNVTVITLNSHSSVTTANAVESLPPLQSNNQRSKSFDVSGYDPVFWSYRFRTNRSQSLSSLRRSISSNRKRVRRLSSIQRENDRLLQMKLKTVVDPSDEEVFITREDYSSSDSSIRLEEHIKLHHLQKLLQIFKSHHPFDKDASKTKNEGKYHDEEASVKQGPGMMTLEEFKNTISHMLGTHRWDDQMEMLFHKVDTACDNFVDWNEFCTYMLLQMREIENKESKKLIPFSYAAIIKQIFHNKQETTTKSIIVENPARILTVSKVGAIGIWDFNLRLLKTYNLSNDVAESQQLTTKRRFHTWVTDLVYMRNTQNLALTTSSREIYFYDISTPIYSIEFCLYALPNVPVCAHYWYNKRARNGHSVLLFGDDTGAIHALHFHTPQSRLFQKPFNPKQGTQRVYFNELRDHKQYVTYENLGDIHDDVVGRVMYVKESDIVISSSMSSTTSVVLMDFERKKKPYIFKVNKGVECFDYSKSLNILVTGSLDHLVRVWNPYVVARPITILQGHSTGICDVALNDAYAQIITYSKDVVIKVWDIKEQTCLQTVSPKFPSLQPGRIPEHGEFPLSLYGSPYDLLLVTCNDSLALLKMGKLAPKEELPTTHSAPLCAALYNQLFRQVVTASDDSTVSVWEIETGAKTSTFSNTHGQEEITCISFDQNNRRLFTGARDGTIKIWNFQNGNCLHELEAVAEAEVTGVLSFQDRTILAVGWSRFISIYDDSDPDIVNISAKNNWKGGQLHQDDILTVAHGHPNLLATASYDGCILVWNEETQQLYMKLREGKHGKSNELSRSVDLLVFLQERSRHPKKNRSTLISSEGGTLYWWCLFGRNTLLGYFGATETKDGSVLAISPTHDDVYLVTGDTSGYITVWNIEDYCVTDQNEETVTEKPAIVYHWKAHDSAIVSVNYIDHEMQALIVTASTDKTSRLWTLEGRLIGTFGQRKKWNLKKPSTYQHPMNPWGEKVTMREPGNAYSKLSLVSQMKKEQPGAEDKKSLLDAISQVQHSSDEIIPDNVDMNSLPPKPEEVGKNVSNGESDENLKSPDNTNQDENDDAGYRLEEAQSNEEIENEAESAENVHQEEMMENFSSSKKEKILGEPTEQIFQQRSKTRQERRNRVGFIDQKRTSRFGNLCSPFQALNIRDTESVFFHPSMPMTARMHEEGMHCNNESDLIKMPLNKFCESEDQQEQTPRGHRRHGTSRR